MASSSKETSTYFTNMIIDEDRELAEELGLICVVLQRRAGSTCPSHFRFWPKMHPSRTPFLPSEVTWEYVHLEPIRNVCWHRPWSRVRNPCTALGADVRCSAGMKRG